MRIVAWNIHAQIRNVDLGAYIEPALFAMKPDVVVLSEYVASEVEHRRFTKVLEGSGFHWHVSPKTHRQNRLLVASRFPLSAPIELIGEAALAASENYLAVTVNAYNLHFVLVGLRVPYYTYEQRAQRSHYANWLLKQLQPLSDRRALVVGDLNFDPQTRVAKNEWIYAPLRTHLDTSVDDANPDAAWHFCSPPDKEPSFWRGSRIDHGLRTRTMLTPTAVKYIAEVNGQRIMTRSRPSDHAALMLDFNFAAD